MKRCFAFGCSFTHWFYWPTWADFIGINFDEYYNFAMPGSSNKMVHNRFIEANDFYKFTPDDLILIGITNFGRLNWLEDKDDTVSWCCHGGPQNWPDNSKTNFLRNNFWKQNYGIYDTWLMVKNVSQLLRSLRVSYKIIMSLDNGYFLGRDLLELSDKEIQMSREIYDNCIAPQSLQEFSSDKNHHPTAIEHFQYAEKYLPEYLTDKSNELFREVVSTMGFDCSDENCQKYGQIRAKYLNDLSPVEFPMYGKYH